ncbi:hypothetical protein [Streptomyces fragilis]|uniref:Uncharacterized protein n=1 Tax=Streptomyces fragilis TaxID=67301 RepID=A0ABV2YI64_9ACTN|nr:hypothetical protein [Streptomyces fragilis]
MSEETVPPQFVPGGSGTQGVPQQPAGLLQQMEELMAALNADLSDLGAALGTTTEGPDPAA